MSLTKVLLVDDEVEFASTLAERLELRHYEVRTAGNALEGLGLIYKYAPDVVILDLKIPGMDGIEALKAIKKHDPSIEVIMLTGHGDGFSVEEGLKNGAFEYIIKPVEIEELMSKIDLAMKKRDKG